MSGVAVIRYLLANNAPVLAVIPAARIIAGDLQLGTVIPAIPVTSIDRVSAFRPVWVNETPKLYDERVQVSPLFYGSKASIPGTGYLGVYQVLKLILAACPSQRGLINGIAVDSIIADIEGPDLHDQDTDLYSKSQDFFVRWSA